MEQYIPKSALVAEIEKLKEENKPNSKSISEYIQGGIYGFDLAIEKTLGILDTLEVKEVQEEPISEELGDYINELSKQFPEVSFAKLSRIAVRVAKWKEKEMQSTIELAEDHAMLAGIIKGTEHTIGKVRSILNKVAYRNNGLDVNGDYCEQPYVELDNEFRKLFKED